jgi:NitT/TauT family transport system substrate-binding protein
MRSELPKFQSICVLALALLLSGCQRTHGVHKYRIGLGPFAGFGPLYLAQAKGYFKDAGIDAELVVVTGVAERNTALRTQRIDALAAPIDYFVLSRGTGIAAKAVMAIDESVGADGLVVNSSIKNFADLRGKTVAFQHAMPSEFFLRALLQQSGLRMNDIKGMDMETATGGSAFVAHRVDAAVLWEPWLSRASTEGGGRVIASSKTYPNLIVDTLGFTDKTIADSPNDVRAIVNAVLKAIDYAKVHPEEANSIMGPPFQVDAARYATIVKGLDFCDAARNREYFGTSQNPGPIYKVAQRASAVWMEAGAISNPVDPSQVIASAFVDRGSE